MREVFTKLSEIRTCHATAESLRRKIVINSAPKMTVAFRADGTIDHEALRARWSPETQLFFTRCDQLSELYMTALHLLGVPTISEEHDARIVRVLDAAADVVEQMWGRR